MNGREGPWNKNRKTMWRFFFLFSSFLSFCFSFNHNTISRYTEKCPGELKNNHIVKCTGVSRKKSPLAWSYLWLFGEREIYIYSFKQKKGKGNKDLCTKVLHSKVFKLWSVSREFEYTIHHTLRIPPRWFISTCSHVALESSASMSLYSQSG